MLVYFLQVINLVSLVNTCWALASAAFSQTADIVFTFLQKNNRKEMFKVLAYNRVDGPHGYLQARSIQAGQTQQMLQKQSLLL